MTIRSKGTNRGGATAVPNWWLESDDLDPFELRVIIWLHSHRDQYRDTLTRNSIAQRLGMSRDKAGKALAHLAELGLIEVETVQVSPREGNVRFVITVDLDAWNTPPVDAPRPPTWTPHVHPGGRPTSTSKETQGVEQEEPPSTPPLTLDVAVPDPTVGEFEQLWQLYPRKRRLGRVQTLAVYRRESRGVGFDTILDGLNRWRIEWAARGEQYAPDMKRWLRERRWESAPEPTEMRPRDKAALAVKLYTEQQRANGCVNGVPRPTLPAHG